MDNLEYGGAAARLRVACVVFGVTMAALCHGKEAPLQTANRSDAPDRVALVMGNGDYKNVPALDNPTNDARAMCAMLTRLGFSVKCIENVKSRREMKNLMLDFGSRLSKGSIALFFYAGHGFQAHGQNYLLPTEAALTIPADVEDEGLPLGYLMSQFETAKSELNIVILDACRNNPLNGRRSSANGLAAVDAPPDTVILYATSPGKEAFDGGANSHGAFTGQLLRHMATPGLAVEDMIKSVIKGVQEETLRKYNEMQTPWVNSSYSGRFCFAGCDLNSAEVEQLRAEKARLEARTKELERRSAERDLQIKALETELSRGRTADGSDTTLSDPDYVIRLEEQLKILKSNNEALRQESAALNVDQGQVEELRKRLFELERRAKEYDDLTKKLSAAETRATKAEPGPRPSEESLAGPRASPAKRKRNQAPPPTF